MKPFVEDKILDNLPIREGSEVYKGWKDPPVTPVVSFRIFNLTNKDAILKGKHLKENQTGSKNHTAVGI